eukprot:1584201-Rhodomonas_salina.6
MAYGATGQTAQSSGQRRSATRPAYAPPTHPNQRPWPCKLYQSNASCTRDVLGCDGLAFYFAVQCPVLTSCMDHTAPSSHLNSASGLDAEAKGTPTAVALFVAGPENGETESTEGGITCPDHVTLVSSAMGLRNWYSMPGTDAAYATTRRLCTTGSDLLTGCSGWYNNISMVYDELEADCASERSESPSVGARLSSYLMPTSTCSSTLRGDEMSSTDVQAADRPTCFLSAAATRFQMLTTATLLGRTAAGTCR